MKVYCSEWKVWCASQRVRTSTAFEIGQTSLQSLNTSACVMPDASSSDMLFWRHWSSAHKRMKLFEPLEADEPEADAFELPEPEEEVLPDADAQLLQL